ncbi:hypothetical protein OROHE_020031 [Orobanche hederae]
MESEEAATRTPAANSKKTASILPFVEGGLAGLLTSSVSFLGNYLNYNLGYPFLSSTAKANYDSYFKKFPTRLFINTTTTTAQLGSFMYLKQRLEAANCGRPLNLYQEACCGMAAGATFAFFGSPLYLACRRIDTKGALISVQQSCFRNLMLDLCYTAMDKGVLALWRGGGHYTAWAIGHNTGMLASYYLRSNGTAAVMSGVFASACGVSCGYIYHATKLVRNNKNYQGKSFLECALQSWKLWGNKYLYKTFLDLFSKNTPHLVMTWLCFEEVRNAMQKRP